MSAAEKIAAAIEKLGQMVATEADVDGPWRVEVHTDRTASIFDHDDVPVALDISPLDAESIVTLRRTIDAQLAILRDALADLQPGWAGMVQPDENYELQVDLARAILGELS